MDLDLEELLVLGRKRRTAGNVTNLELGLRQKLLMWRVNMEAVECSGGRPSATVAWGQDLGLRTC